MKTIAFASAWLLTFGFVCSASAAGSAIDELGGQPGLAPVPAAAAAAAAGQAAPDIDIFSYFGYAKTPRPAPIFFEKSAVSRAPVFSISLSASVDLPWSICAMMAKFLIFSISSEDG